MYYGNINSLKEYTDQGCYPLHCSALALQSFLPTNLHKIAMVNLYISSNLLKARLVAIWDHGVWSVCWVLFRGIPYNIKQDDEIQQDKKITSKGIVKVADFIGDEILNKYGVDGDLISLYFYDNKPVYVMTNDCDTIKWVENKWKVWWKSLNEMV